MLRIAWSWMRAWEVLVARAGRGELRPGWHRAWRMSRSAARMMSLEEARGMETLVGNQTTVSDTRSRWVEVIQTR